MARGGGGGDGDGGEAGEGDAAGKGRRRSRRMRARRRRRWTGRGRRTARARRRRRRSRGGARRGDGARGSGGLAEDGGTGGGSGVEGVASRRGGETRHPGRLDRDVARWSTIGRERAREDAPGRERRSETRTWSLRGKLADGAGRRAVGARMGCGAAPSAASLIRSVGEYTGRSHADRRNACALARDGFSAENGRLAPLARSPRRRRRWRARIPRADRRLFPTYATAHSPSPSSTTSDPKASHRGRRDAFGSRAPLRPEVGSRAARRGAYRRARRVGGRSRRVGVQARRVGGRARRVGGRARRARRGDPRGARVPRASARPLLRRG